MQKLNMFQYYNLKILCDNDYFVKRLQMCSCRYGRKFILIEQLKFNYFKSVGSSLTFESYFFFCMVLPFHTNCESKYYEIYNCK